MINFEYPEGATPIDLDEAHGLRLTHITTRGELDRWEQDNIIHALAWLDRTKPSDILNEPFIKALHRHMFGDVWKWAATSGTATRTSVGPGIKSRRV
jgi:fido (protein-threonine AMPylation protein)